MKLYNCSSFLYYKYASGYYNYVCICVVENPYYRLLTNQTIYAPLASSPLISIIVAIDSDGTVSQQDDVVTDSLVLARPNDEDIIGVFEQDSNNFQLYHFMFPPLQKQDVGQYVISSSGMNFSVSYIHHHLLYAFQKLMSS